MTDPELDLLREVLADDPTDEAFVEVGRELIRRELWEDALAVLSPGCAGHPDDHEAAGLLARAAMGAGKPKAALEALAGFDLTPESADPDLVVLEIAALAACGQRERALALAESLVLLHPERGPAENLVPATNAPPPAAPRRAPEPLLTLAQVDRYQTAGRTDRAVRVLRRMLFRQPGRADLKSRLDRLLGQPHVPVVDDLSEELPDPALAPALEVRSPYRASAHVDEEETQPAISVEAVRRELEAINAGGTDPTVAVEDLPIVAESSSSSADAEGRSPAGPLPGIGDLAAALQADDFGDSRDEDVTDPGLATTSSPAPLRKPRRSLIKR